MDETLPAEPGRRERKRQQLQDHLAQTAWALFEADGFEAVTMERIADAADISKVTLYKHFPLKEAFLPYLFHQELAAAWPAIRSELAAVPPGRPRLERFFALQAEWCERRRPYLLAYVRQRLTDKRDPAKAGEGRSGMDRMFAEMIAEGQEAGLFRRDQTPALLAHYLQFAHLAAMLRWLTQPGVALADALQQMLDLICDGMGSPR